MKKAWWQCETGLPPARCRDPAKPANEPAPVVPVPGRVGCARQNSLRRYAFAVIFKVGHCAVPPLFYKIAENFFRVRVEVGAGDSNQIRARRPGEILDFIACHRGFIP